VAVVSPGLAETDVAKADGAPREEGSKTGQRNEPVKDGLSGRSHVHITEDTPQKNEDDGEQWATGAIHVCENLGSIALISKSRQGTRTSVDTGDTDGNDRDENDDVHKVVETMETSIARSNDEGGSIGTRGTKKILVVGANKETDKGKADNVEESNTPEDLSDGTGKRLEGVGSLSGRQTDKLSTGEREGGGDEDGAEALEAILEGARVIPQTGSPVFVVQAVGGASTEHKNQGGDHENNRGHELEAGGPELFLSVTQRTEYVDDDDEDPEYRYPDS
jgi:hypothetical protein